MKAYVYILNGKVVINPEEKPKSEIGMEDLALICSEKITAREYVDRILKPWKDNCIEVENVKSEDMGSEGVVWFVLLGYKRMSLFTSGSQVEHDGPVITEIL